MVYLPFLTRISKIDNSFGTWSTVLSSGFVCIERVCTWGLNAFYLMHSFMYYIQHCVYLMWWDFEGTSERVICVITYVTSFILVYFLVVSSFRSWYLWVMVANKTNRSQSKKDTHT